MGFSLKWPLLFGMVLLVVLESTARPRPDASYDSHLSSLDLAIIKCIVETVPGVTKGGGDSYDWTVVQSRSKELQGAEIEVVQVQERDPEFSRNPANSGYPDDWSVVRSVSRHLDRQRGYPVSGGNERGGYSDNWVIVRSISTELHLDPQYSPEVPSSQPAHPPPEVTLHLDPELAPDIPSSQPANPPEAQLNLDYPEFTPDIPSSQPANPPEAQLDLDDPEFTPELPSSQPANPPEAQLNSDDPEFTPDIPSSHPANPPEAQLNVDPEFTPELPSSHPANLSEAQLNVDPEFTPELPSSHPANPPEAQLNIDPEFTPTLPSSQPANPTPQAQEMIAIDHLPTREGIDVRLGGKPISEVSREHTSGGGLSDWSIERSISSELPSEIIPDVAGYQPGHEMVSFDELPTREGIDIRLGGKPISEVSREHTSGGGLSDWSIERSISSAFGGREGFDDGKSEQQSFGSAAVGSTHQIPSEQNNGGAKVGWNIVRSISSEQEPIKGEEMFSSRSQQTDSTSGTQAEIGGTDDYNVFPRISTELQPVDNEAGEVPANLTEIFPPPEAQTGGGDYSWNNSWNNPQLNAGGQSEFLSPGNIETAPLNSPQPCETGQKRINNACRKVYTFQLKSKVR